MTGSQRTRLLVALSAAAAIALAVASYTSVYAYFHLDQLANRNARTARSAKAASVEAQRALAGFEQLTREQRAAVHRDLVRLRQQNSETRALAQRIQAVASQRAQDQAVALETQASLNSQNRSTIMQLAALQTEQRRTAGQRTHAICVEIERVKRTIRNSISASDRSLGQPGTAGYTYYKVFPQELARAHAQNRVEINRFRARHCPK